MSKLIGLLAVFAIGMWAIGGFGSLFGLSKEDVTTVNIYKDKAIDKAAPIVAPLISRQQIHDTEQNINRALPTPAEVQTTLDSTIVPAIISTAKKIGEAAQQDMTRSSQSSQQSFLEAQRRIATEQHHAPVETQPSEEELHRD